MTMNRETKISLRKFVFHYIVPMFLIALVLVLATYFCEQRRAGNLEQREMQETETGERDERLSAMDQRIAVMDETLGE